MLVNISQVRQSICVEFLKGGFINFVLKAKYIASCLDEIKQELRQENAVVKANAVAKLTYVSGEHGVMII